VVAGQRGHDASCTPQQERGAREKHANFAAATAATAVIVAATTTAFIAAAAAADNTAALE